MNNTNMEPIIVVHGGAGYIPQVRVPAKLTGVKASARIGYEILKNGGTALDAVEAAIKYMEDGEAFNAGYGSVLNIDGEVEMDASVMVGSDLRAGAVSIVKDIAHPISLARLVMEKTPHIMFAGTGANRLANELGVPKVPPGNLISESARTALEDFKMMKKYMTEASRKASERNPGDVGTVGAVALDKNGNLVAGTSTGGQNGRMVGRCSDTSMLGCGTYADDQAGAVSTTGHGETIARFCLAHDIIKEMEHGLSAQEATEKSLKKMTDRLNHTAGAITLSKTGEVGIYFTSDHMSWAYQKGNKITYGLKHDQVLCEEI